MTKRKKYRHLAIQDPHNVKKTNIDKGVRRHEKFNISLLKSPMFYDYTGMLAKVMASKEKLILAFGPLTGKTTNVEILAEMIKGKRESFRNLAVNSPQSPWNIPEPGTYHLIKLSFLGMANDCINANQVKAMMAFDIRYCARNQTNTDVEFKVDDPLSMFSEWLDNLQQCEVSKKEIFKEIIVLIDDFEELLTPFVDNEIVSTEIKEFMESFLNLLASRNLYKVYVA